MSHSLSVAEFSQIAQSLSLEEQESLVDILQKQIRLQRQPVTMSSASAIVSQHLDPLEEIIGMINSKVADWADRHDYYLGQSIARKLHSTQDD